MIIHAILVAATVTCFDFGKLAGTLERLRWEDVYILHHKHPDPISPEVIAEIISASKECGKEHDETVQDLIHQRDPK